MSEQRPISVEGVSLAYRLARNRAGTLKEFAISLVKRQVEYEVLWALNDVSFEVRRGEVFGVIGPNGAGKSTLLKVLAKVLPPTSGRVVVHGSVSPMIELGAGFNVELTARENIVLYGTLLGRNPKEMRERVAPIISWAGLEEFANVPVRSFSTGMMARLAFSVASDIQPDVLVVDEVLSVGDQEFARKSMDRMMELIEGGSCVVLVSHNLPMVHELAKRAMWLHRGEVKAIGPADQVVNEYQGAS